MKSKINLTKKQGATFLRRWQIVNAAEKEELKNASVQHKFKQLSSLMQSARRHGWNKHFTKEEKETRKRWVLLIAVYND